VITVIKDVFEVGIERVNIINPREFSEYLAELLVVRGLAELDLAHVEVSNARDLETRVDNCRSLPVCLGQRNVDEFLGIWHCLKLFELVHIHNPSVPLVARLIQEVASGKSQIEKCEL
jgi:hypothetical protein